MKTRQAILDESIRMLARGGFETLSLEVLAETCGVTRGAIYHHFSNKMGLFLAAVEAVSESMGKTIRDWAESGPSGGADPWEALLLGAEGFLKESRKPEYRQIILTDGPAVLGMDRWQEIDDRYTTSTLEDVFGLLRTPARSLENRALAQAFSGAMNQLSRWTAADGDTSTALAVLTEMLRSLLSGAPGQGEAAHPQWTGGSL